MPKIGEIRRGFELGYLSKDPRIWHACVDCGKERWVLLSKGKPTTKRCVNCANRIKAQCRGGNRNSNWKGGISHQGGYVFLRRPEHSQANRYGYVKRSYLVLEEKLGRLLLPNTHCHHINGIKDDDRPENLAELTHCQHSSTTNRRHGRQAKLPQLIF